MVNKLRVYPVLWKIVLGNIISLLKMLQHQSPDRVVLAASAVAFPLVSIYSHPHMPPLPPSWYPIGHLSLQAWTHTPDT